MFRIGAFAADMLNSIDNVAKETLEEPKESSTSIRMRRKIETNSTESLGTLEETITLPELSPASNNSIESAPVDTSPINIENGKSFSADKDLQKHIYKKNKEIEKLNTECLDLERQCESLKKEVHEAWEAYKGVQEKAALREAELLDEISEIEKAKSADRQAMTQHLSTLETNQQSAETELESLRKDNQELLKKCQKMEMETTQWREEEVLLREELKEAKANSNHNLDSLREELRQSQLSLERLSKDQSTSMRQTLRRQEELERTNSELVRNLVEKDREILRYQQLNEKASVNEIYEQEIDNYQKQIETLNSNISEMKSQYELTKRKLSQNEIDHENQKKIWEKERLSLIERYSMTGHVNSNQNGNVFDALNEEIKSKNVIIQQLESQIKSLGQQLLRKQDAMQELLSERAALKVRLQDSQRRYERAEEQLASSLELESHSIYSSHKDDDYEENDLDPSSSSLSSSASTSASSLYGQQLANRKSIKKINKSRVSTEFERMGVKAVPSVANAVDMIDGWTLLTGRFLRNYPLLRISFVLYLVLIHLWVLVILAVHTHSLDLE